jgi:tRNA(Ile2) C34 agmatinyltransferase TiaS
MKITEAFDEILEDTVCPKCGTVGMNSIGSWDYECPNCDYEGSVEND